MEFDGLSFEAANSLLIKSSKTYRKMFDYLTCHGDFQIISEKTTAYYGCWDAGRRVIRIGPDVKGALMVSVLAFEVTNAFQTNEHEKVDDDARKRLIKQEQFVERHETIEYQGLVMHCQVLKELNNAFGDLPEEMFILCKPPDKKVLVSWIPPDKKSYLKAQNESGHSDHYRRWYFQQRRE